MGIVAITLDNRNAAKKLRDLIMSDYTVTHLKQLESEAIFVLREAAAQFERPVLLFSGGKDSIVMAYLARKAFWPAKIPFPLLHVDTGHNFTETIEFRDRLVEDSGANLVVAYVQKAIDEGRVVEEKGLNASRNALQIQTHLDCLEEGQYDAAPVSYTHLTLPTKRIV